MRGPGAVPLDIVGAESLLGWPSLGILCSTNPPPSLVIPALEIVAEAAFRGVPVVSAFHSPLERDCLEIVLGAGGRAIVCPARHVGTARAEPRVRAAIRDGRFAVASPFLDPRDRRATAALAERRNRLVASLARVLLLPYARPSSRTFSAASFACEIGTRIACLDHAANGDLRLIGADCVGNWSDLEVAGGFDPADGIARQ